MKITFFKLTTYLISCFGRLSLSVTDGLWICLFKKKCSGVLNSKGAKVTFDN